MEKEQSSSNSFKTYFRYLLKAIADYQEEVIETNFIGLSDNEIIRTARKQTFLSYAYYDKGLTIFGFDLAFYMLIGCGMEQIITVPPPRRNWKML